MGSTCVFRPDMSRGLGSSSRRSSTTQVSKYEFRKLWTEACLSSISKHSLMREGLDPFHILFFPHVSVDFERCLGPGSGVDGWIPTNGRMNLPLGGSASLEIGLAKLAFSVAPDKHIVLFPPDEEDQCKKAESQPKKTILTGNKNKAVCPCTNN